MIGNQRLLIVIAGTFLTGTEIFLNVTQRGSPTMTGTKNRMFLTGTRIEIHKTAKTNPGDLNKGATVSSRTADSKEGKFSNEVSSRLLRTIAGRLETKTAHKGNMLHSKNGKQGNFRVLKTGGPNNRAMVIEDVGGLSVIIGKRFFTKAERPFGVFFY